MSVLITNIQRFSLHDGPGIRTTIFLKGCSLRCPWCSNPENLLGEQQFYMKDGKKGIYGIYYETNSLYREIIKDLPFYTGVLTDYQIHCCSNIMDLPGGVTFSGGEPLLQMEQLQPLLEQLHSEHIHMVAETSLYVSERNLLLAMKYIDFFYVDIKILDDKLCSMYLRGNLNQFFSNLNILMRAKKPVIFRVPVIGGFTDHLDHRKKVADLVGSLLNRGNVLKIELLKEHQLGLNKYLSLRSCDKDFVVPEYKGVSDQLMDLYKAELMDRIKDKISVEICRI